jgi:hypothetical protein
MAGYIVGYFEEWADNRNPIIIGYYTTWDQALEVTKKLERENIDYHGGLHEVYLVEITVDKTYFVTSPIVDWIDNYINYRVRTIAGKTALQSNKGRVFEIDLPEPDLQSKPIVYVRTVQIPVTIQRPVTVRRPVPDQDWTRAGPRKPHQPHQPHQPRQPRQPRSRKGKRLSQQSGNATQN